MTTRVALITGGAQGIGRAIALRLAHDGFDVAVDDTPGKEDELKQVTKEIQDLGRKAIMLTDDVTQEERVKEMVERTVKELGRLDVMVANAGLGSAQPVIEADISKWEELWAVNIRGVVLCYKYAAQQMIKQGTGGRIIAASSICGLKGYAYLGSYCMSKAAVRSLTQTTALELLEHNITVNAYAPGVIDTAMTRHEDDKALGGPNAKLKAIMRIPDAKTGQPEDVASVVSYLASPQAHFITGQTITVDGGGLYLSSYHMRAFLKFDNNIELLPNLISKHMAYIAQPKENVYKTQSEVKTKVKDDPITAFPLSANHYPINHVEQDADEAFRRFQDPIFPGQVRQTRRE